MALHNTRGKEGEMLATGYLMRKDYQILECNWKWSYYEIDIIAEKDRVLHFIEVKTRHTLTFGYPEEGVSRKKFLCLKKAAAAYLAMHPGWRMVQYDILSILRLDRNKPEFLFIEDVYL